MLVLYGGVLLVAGAIVLTGVVTPAGPVDRAAMRWHMLVWDSWFLLWGCYSASPCSPIAGTPITQPAPDGPTGGMCGCRSSPLAWCVTATA